MYLEVTIEKSNVLRGCSFGGKVAQLGGLAHLGEMTFIPRSYGIFYLVVVQSKSLLFR